MVPYARSSQRAMVRILGVKPSFLGFLRLGNASRDSTRTDRRWEAGLSRGVSLRPADENAPSDADTRDERMPQHVQIPSPQTLKSYFQPHFALPLLHCPGLLLLFSPQGAGSRALAKLGGSSSGGEASRMGYEQGELGEGSLCCRVVRFSYASVKPKGRIPHCPSDLRQGADEP